MPLWVELHSETPDPDLLLASARAKGRPSIQQQAKSFPPLKESV